MHFVDEDKTYSPLIDTDRYDRLMSEMSSGAYGSLRNYKEDGDILNAIYDVFLNRLKSSMSLGSASEDADEDIWAAFESVLSQYPDDALSDLPSDLSEKHDSYVYRKK